MAKNTYECMFLLDTNKVSGDVPAAQQQIHQLLERNQAEILASRPWDERRLAYPIKGQKKGLYPIAAPVAPNSDNKAVPGTKPANKAGIASPGIRSMAARGAAANSNGNPVTIQCANVLAAAIPMPVASSSRPEPGVESRK